jgi:ubiquinol-cytochrome c reductase cytochrome b subunit
MFFWLLVIDCIVLGVVGANPPEGAWILVGRLATAWYFIHFLLILPLLGRIEKTRPLPASISEAVIKKDNGARASATPAE